MMKKNVTREPHVEEEEASGGTKTNERYSFPRSNAGGTLLEYKNGRRPHTVTQ
jgi:hypothetical protein